MNSWAGRRVLFLCLFCALLWPKPLLAGDSETIGFPAADGYWIYADYYPPTSTYVDAPIVILLHDAHADRQCWAGLIAPLREAGFAVLAPDLRGHGQSATSDTLAKPNPDTQPFCDAQSDLRGAYDFLAKQKGLDRARLALVAAGAAAQLAARYAGADRSVDALVLLSPDAGESARDLAGDLGQVHGRHVLFVVAEDRRTECEALARRTDGAEKRFCPGAGRGTELLSTVPKLDKDIATFLLRSVGSPSKTVVYGSIERNIYHRPGSDWIARIDPSNLRHYSSPEEAEARGLRASKSKGPSDTQPANSRPPKGRNPARPNTGP